MSTDVSDAEKLRRVKKLLDEVGWRLNHVSHRARLSPGGDEATFGSTGDLDLLREARELVDEWRLG